MVVSSSTRKKLTRNGIRQLVVSKVWMMRRVTSGIGAHGPIGDGAGGGAAFGEERLVEHASDWYDQSVAIRNAHLAIRDVRVCRYLPGRFLTRS